MEADEMYRLPRVTCGRCGGQKRLNGAWCWLCQGVGTAIKAIHERWIHAGKPNSQEG